MSNTCVESKKFSLSQKIITVLLSYAVVDVRTSRSASDSPKVATFIINGFSKPSLPLGIFELIDLGDAQSVEKLR